MAGALTAYGINVSVAGNASYDLRPPAGEVWVISTYQATEAHNLLWVNGTGASTTSLGGVDGSWRPILHNSKMWLRAVDTLGTGGSFRFFGFKMTEGDPYVPAVGAWDIPASTTVEVRPAAGKVWVISDLALFDSNVTFQIYNGSTGTSSGITYTGSGTPVSRRKVVLTNSVWLRATNAGGSAQKCVLNGWEHADTTVKPLVGMTQTANGVTEELAPPSDETYVMTHWSASNWTFNIEGNSGMSHPSQSITGSTGYAANVAISGTGSWARRTGDGNWYYYLGFKI